MNHFRRCLAVLTSKDGRVQAVPRDRTAVQGATGRLYPHLQAGQGSPGRRRPDGGDRLLGEQERSRRPRKPGRRRLSPRGKLGRRGTHTRGRVDFGPACAVSLILECRVVRIPCTTRTASSARSSGARSRRPGCSRRPTPSPSSTSTRSIRVTRSWCHALTTLHLGELPDEIAAHAGSLLPRLCRAVQGRHRRRRAQRDRQQRPSPARPSTTATGTSSPASPTIPSTGPGRRRIQRRRAQPDEVSHRARTERAHRTSRRLTRSPSAFCGSVPERARRAGCFCVPGRAKLPLSRGW